MKTMQLVRGAALAAALGVSAFAQAQTTPIQFNPNGTGGPGVSVATFDWAVNSAIALGGNPGGGLVAGSKVVVLSQASLAALQDSVGFPIGVPAGTQFTFVTGFGEIVTGCAGPGCAAASFAFDPTQLAQNFFEIWVKTSPTPFSSNLAGTGFNTSKRIMFGKVNDASGNFGVGACPSGGIENFDQFNANDWLGQLTICGSGSTQLSVQVLSLDPDYFPGFTQAQVDSLIARFNTSTVVPYRQADPSRQFIGNDAGNDGLAVQPVVVSNNLGPVNGLTDGNNNHDFQFQADANQGFEQGVVVPGACRVTYGGNDRNGNIAPNSFGQACMKVKGGQENCYTFGGQVGAPTANPLFGGPFGEHTHHQVSGPDGDFVFRAGTHSAPERTRITGVACKDPGACQPAAANAGFKQIDFEGTGSFRTLDPVATGILAGRAGHPVVPDHQDDRKYYFRVDMDDFGEPGNKFAKGISPAMANAFLTTDPNAPLSSPDPAGSCGYADVYQFYICKDATPCEPNSGSVIYQVGAYLTGGNIQLHKVIK